MEKKGFVFEVSGEFVWAVVLLLIILLFASLIFFKDQAGGSILVSFLKIFG